MCCYCISTLAFMQVHPLSITKIHNKFQKTFPKRFCKIVTNGTKTQAIYLTRPMPSCTYNHVCQCAHACISMSALICGYFMSRHASVFRYLKSFCLWFIVSTLDSGKQQQCIPVLVAGWEQSHPGPLWFIWNLNWTLTGCVDIKLLSPPK